MSQPALPTFDSKAPCRKCGTDRALALYASERDVLVRTCRLCAYTWDETPLDRADREKWKRFIERHSKK